MRALGLCSGASSYAVESGKGDYSASSKAGYVRCEKTRDRFSEGKD